MREFYLEEDGFLKTFFEKTKNMSPEERASYLESDEASCMILFINQVCSRRS